MSRIWSELNIFQYFDFERARFEPLIEGSPDNIPHPEA